MSTMSTDREVFESRLRQLLADDFVRVDLRQLVAMPRATRDEFIAVSLMTHFDLDVVPHTETDDVLAVSGDRLGLIRARLVYDGSGQIEYLAVVRFDDAVEQLERMVMFDPDDLEAARAELDRLAVMLLEPEG